MDHCAEHRSCVAITLLTMRRPALARPPRGRRPWRLEVFRSELATAVDGTSRNHELAFTTVLDRLRSFRGHGDVSLDDLPDEQAVAPNHAGVVETALEIRVAVRDQGRWELGHPPFWC